MIIQKLTSLKNLTIYWFSRIEFTVILRPYLLIAAVIYHLKGGLKKSRKKEIKNKQIWCSRKLIKYILMNWSRLVILMKSFVCTMKLSKPVRIYRLLCAREYITYRSLAKKVLKENLNKASSKKVSGITWYFEKNDLKLSSDKDI